MTRASFFLVLLGWGCIFGARAQQYPMHNYTMQDGLPNSLVYRIFQDKKGFIWFCTDNGLSLFNGKTFHNYFTADGLANDCVMSISEDISGNKMISTYGGGVSLMTDNSVVNYPGFINSQSKKIVFATIHRNCTWFIGNSGGQSLFRIKNGGVTELPIKNAIGGKVFFNKLISIEDELLYATSDGIYKTKDDTVVTILHDIIHEPVIDIRKSNSGGYWIGLDTRIILVRNNKIEKAFPVGKNQRISDMLVDRNNNVWVALGHCVLLIKNGAVTDITANLRMQRTIINDMFEDAEGNIWIATYNEGVYRLNSLDIENYFAEGNNTSIYTTAIAPMDGNGILISSIGKVNIWSSGQTRPLNLKLLKTNEYIYTVRYFDDKIYAGIPEGLYIKNNKPPFSDQIIRPETGSGVVSFCKDSKDRIWVGGYAGIFRLVNNELVIDTAADRLLYLKRCRSIIEDHSGNIWFGTDSGLIVYDGNEYKRLPLPPSPDINMIYSVFEDSHKRIWLGTKGGLVCRENNKFRIFTVDDGLAHNKCNAITEDRNNTLWIATLCGLSYTNLNNLDIKGYRTGIYPSEILSLYCNDSNYIFVGTSNGMSIIKKEDTTASDAPPPVYITAVKTTGSHGNMPRQVNLPYNENRLTIDFIGINYRNPNMVEYRYKIINLDNNWHTTRNTSIELSSIPPGVYSFVLNARQNKGKWSSDVSLPIYVPTPIWKRAWFVICASLAISIAIFLITRWQILKSEYKKREQLSLYNKVIYLKQQALSALINPHFIFNCMNSIQHYLNSHNNDLANDYLADFASLIRMTMDNAQEAFIHLNKEIDRIRLYLSLEQLRFGEALQYDIIIDENLDTNAIQIPNMILQPYIENAILHGIIPKNASGQILIRFQGENDGLLRIIIEDDGVGLHAHNSTRSSPGGHVPLGMKLTLERLYLLQKLLGQSYSIKVEEMLNEQNKPKGTIVEIIIPFRPAFDIARTEKELNEPS